MFIVGLFLRVVIIAAVLLVGFSIWILGEYVVWGRKLSDEEMKNHPKLRKRIKK